MPTEDERRKDRFRGCLLGLACGDALGATVEFMSAGAIAARFGTHRDLIGGGPFDWPPGAYTDDTQMMLALAQSLIAHPAGDLNDMARRWIAWLHTGPPDVGATTRAALRLIESRPGADPREAGREIWERSGQRSAANGGLMRCAPIGLLFSRRSADLRRVSDDSCAISHFDPRCRASCIALNQAIAALVNGTVPDLEDLAGGVEALSNVMAEAIRAVPALPKTDLNTSGYTVTTLQAALWALWSFDNPEDGIVSVVNLGDDADTVGAVAGALLGARDGESAIPQRWLGQLQDTDRLRETADRILELSLGEHESDAG